MNPENSHPRLLIITPARDEARFIQRTIQSLADQTWRPDRWVIVDDGSTDGMGEIARQAAEKYPWIRVITRQSAERKVGPGVVDAFYEGLASENINDFDFVCKLDADIEFAPDYFARLLEMFRADPRLGTVSGKCEIPVGDKWVLERSGDEFSHGVAKLYRRQCFQEIGGFVREVMWDGIDCHRCRMLGWKAQSLDDPGLRIRHLRQMGSSHKSIWHGRMRWGRGQWFMGTTPAYLLAITAYRMLERPFILGGLGIFTGYVQAAWTGHRRLEDPQFRKHLRGWQWKKLNPLAARQ